MYYSLASWTLTVLTALIGITFVTLTISYIWFMCARRRLIYVARNLPTAVPPFPIFGHLLYMLRQPSKIKTKLIETMMRTTAARGEGTFVLWVGPYPSIHIQLPEDIQIVLNSSKSLHKGFIYKMVEFATGCGLFTGPVSRWKMIRRHFQPVFHSSNVKHVVPASNERGRQVVDILRERCSPSAVDVLPFMRVITFQNICNLLFGDESSKSPPRDLDVPQSVVGSILGTFELWSRRIATPWLLSDRIFHLFFKNDIKEILKVHQSFLRIPLEILKEKMAEKSENKSLSNPGKSRISAYDAFMALNEADSSFNDQHFSGEIFTLYAAGTNTTSVTLSSCMLALAWHQDIQEKLHGEIVSVMGKSFIRDVAIDDLREMPYLDQVVKETLRRFSVFTRIQRKTLEDLRLSFGVLPAGTTFQIGIAGVHMNPLIHTKSELFDPDRFSAENTAKRPKYSFIPFSGGPRNCIAGEYAIMLVKIVLIHIINKYKLHTSLRMSDVTLKFMIEVQIEQGYPIRVEERF